MDFIDLVSKGQFEEWAKENPITQEGATRKGLSIVKSKCAELIVLAYNWIRDCDRFGGVVKGKISINWPEREVVLTFDKATQKYKSEIIYFITYEVL